MVAGRTLSGKGNEGFVFCLRSVDPPGKCTHHLKRHEHIDDTKQREDSPRGKGTDEGPKGWMDGGWVDDTGSR